MYRTVLGHQIQVAPLNKKVVKVGGAMVWCVAPGRFAVKGWNTPMKARSIGYYSTLWAAVNSAKTAF